MFVKMQRPSWASSVTTASATCASATAAGSAFPEADSSTRRDCRVRFIPVAGTARRGNAAITRHSTQPSTWTTRSTSVADSGRRRFRPTGKSTWKCRYPTTASASLPPLTWRCSIPVAAPAASRLDRNSRCVPTGRMCVDWTLPASGTGRTIRTIPARSACWIAPTRGVKDARVNWI